MQAPGNTLFAATCAFLATCLLCPLPAQGDDTENREPPDSLQGPPFVNATAWAIADGRTGALLHGMNEGNALPMASTTKVMTALVVMRLIAADAKVLDEVVTVSRFAAGTAGSSANLRPGDKLPVRELLYGLLLPSGNDAANAIAEHFGARLRAPTGPDAVPWNVRSAGRSKVWAHFIAEMNRSARRLKLRDTHYVNPHGLDAKRHQSTARDILVLTRAALRFAEFKKRVATRLHRTTITTGSGTRRSVEWRNSNQLLKVQGYIGVKTGTTAKAGACLISAAERGEDRLLMVVLNSSGRRGRYVDTRNLFRWAFNQRLAGGK